MWSLLNKDGVWNTLDARPIAPSKDQWLLWCCSTTCSFFLCCITLLISLFLVGSWSHMKIVPFGCWSHMKIVPYWLLVTHENNSLLVVGHTWRQCCWRWKQVSQLNPDAKMLRPCKDTDRTKHPIWHTLTICFKLCKHWKVNSNSSNMSFKVSMHIWLWKISKCQHERKYTT